MAEELPPRRNPDQLAVDLAVRLALLALFAYVALTLMRPFISILLWSVVLTVAFYPVFTWLRRHLGGRGWAAATLLTGGAMAVVVGPITVLVSSLVVSLEAVARRLGAGHADLPQAPAALGQLPVVGPTLVTNWNQAATNLDGFLERYSRVLLGAGEWLLHLIEGLGGSIAAVLAAVIVAGFLYGPAPWLVSEFRRFAARVVGPRGSSFVDLATATIRTVARGVIGVAIIQTLGIAAGLMVAGVPAVGLLTLVILVLAIVQIGSMPVVIPLLIWAWFSMPTLTALLLTIYLVPWMLSDNVLRPLLMRHGLTTPLPVIFIGVFGGTIAYGLVGLFLGPVVLAVFYDLVRCWTDSEPASREGGIE